MKPDSIEGKDFFKCRISLIDHILRYIDGKFGFQREVDLVKEILDREKIRCSELYTTPKEKKMSNEPCVWSEKEIYYMFDKWFAYKQECANKEKFVPHLCESKCKNVRCKRDEATSQLNIHTNDTYVKYRCEFCPFCGEQ
jgi:hypothetical protein